MALQTSMFLWQEEDTIMRNSVFCVVCAKMLKAGRHSRHGQPRVKAG
jgi:hypothetical protein